MITDEDMVRLSEIRRRANTGNPADPADPADRAFLIDLVDRLSREKPDDFQFPAYAALVNDQANRAYAMRLDSRVHRESTLRLFGAGLTTVDAFRQDISCDVCAAEMFVRPYVRVVEPKTGQVLEQLSSGTLSLVIDDLVVLEKFPLRDFLCGLDGYGVRRRPFSLAGFLPLQGPLFRACVLEPPGAAPAPFNLAPVASPNILATGSDWHGNGSLEYGLMLPNASTIQIRLEAPVNSSEPLLLAIGVVSALYTTKVKILRKQDWSPRDPA